MPIDQSQEDWLDMVIAGIVIYTHPYCGDIVLPGLCEMYRVSSDKLAGVVEGISVGEVEKKVDTIRKTSGVLNVSYAYMNFEDLDNQIIPECRGCDTLL